MIIHLINNLTKDTNIALNRSVLAMGLLFFAFSILVGSSFGQETKPNILIIYGDDTNYDEFPMYGGQVIETPNIDRLAKQGLTFNKAFQAMAMCAPSRAELYTGMYPVRNGVAWNHANARPGIKSIVHRLGDLGYRVGITGKVHAGPKSVFPFQEYSILEEGSISDKKFEEYANEGDQPFCLIVASHQPHGPWNKGNPGKINSDQPYLPPYVVDTKLTRELYRNYLAEIEYLDMQVGQVLAALEKTGKANNTLVIFTSEHGSPFPGGKWTNWNIGVHTAFVVRWPGVIASNLRTNALIQYADVLPTLVDIAGGKVSNHQFDGFSFLHVLQGETNKHRDYAYFMHNNVPEGPPYPIRSVTDGTYHYIRNLSREKLWIEKHVFGALPTPEFLQTWFYQAATNEHARNMIQRFMLRPTEELYHLEQDPYEFKNLAANPELETIKEKLSNELNKWLKSQNDPGAALDTWSAYKQNGGYKDK